MKLKHKIPLIIGAFAIGSGIIFGYFQHRNTVHWVESVNRERLQEIVVSQRTALLKDLQSIRSHLRTQSKDPSILNAFKEFAEITAEWSPRDWKNLNKAYTIDNPNPAGVRERLDSAAPQSPYGARHAKYHAWLRQIRRDSGYYDIFLFDPRGNLMYTAVKENDFATNMLSGPWKGSGLADAFRKANRKTGADHQVLVDFAPYAPSNGDLAGFLATPVRDRDGALLGVLAAQLSRDRIAEIVEPPIEYRAATKTFLFGNNNQLLTTSGGNLDTGSEAAQSLLHHNNHAGALIGKTGDGRMVLSHRLPVDFMGAQWTIVAETEMDAIRAPVYAMTLELIQIGLLLTLLLGPLGWIVGRRIALPLYQLNETAARFKSMDLTISSAADSRTDEIGELSRSFNAMAVTLKDTFDRNTREIQGKEARLSGLMESVEEGIITTNQKGDIETANPAALKILGLQKGKLVGTNIDRVISTSKKSVLPQISDSDQQNGDKQSSGAVTCEATGKRNNGEDQALEITVTEMSIGGNRKFIATLRDVTERKKIEAVSTRLGRILEDSLNEIFIFDAETLRFTQVNRGARENLGYTMEELRGFTAFDIKPEVPEELFREMIRPLLDGDIQVSEFETVHQRKDGTRYDVEVHLQYMTTEDPPLFAAIIQDITGRVADRQALEQARDEAEAANRTKSAFLANMSHELRTPLNAIIGYSEMLTEIAEEEDQQDNIPDLNKIHDAGTHLLSLINEILDLSKIEAGKIGLECRNFSVAKMIETSVDLVRPQIEKNGNQFEIDCPADIGDMRGDETRIRQVIYNLLGNAAKFTSDGDIGLKVSRETRDGSDWIEFQISDTGIGIDKNLIANLFQDFTQADASTTREYGGTGLGLSISRRFCIMMGGDIEVDSTPGEGSVFTVRLQGDIGAALDSTLPAMGFDKGAEGIMGDAVFSETIRDRPILIIDDELDALDLLTRTLTGDGFRVITARTGEEGLELAKRENPAVITLDVELPGSDGWQVLKAFKADPDLAHIPIILCTIVDDKNRGHALGASEFLVKPINRAELVTVVGKFASMERCHALLVEDDPASREMMVRTIAKSGCQVTEANNGLAALEALSRIRPSVIILDLMMPGMDGFEFLDKLQSREEDRNIPVVVLTARELSDEDRRRLDGKAKYVVEKTSLKFSELAQEIRRLAIQASNPPSESHLEQSQG
jgi:PAS domain S-box-containing protein